MPGSSVWPSAPSRTWIAQDEASSVVWGMPGLVARSGIADAIVPLEGLAAEIERRLAAGRVNPPSLDPVGVGP